MAFTRGTWAIIGLGLLALALGAVCVVTIKLGTGSAVV